MTSPETMRPGGAEVVAQFYEDLACIDTYKDIDVGTHGALINSARSLTGITPRLFSVGHFLKDMVLDAPVYPIVFSGLRQFHQSPKYVPYGYHRAMNEHFQRARRQLDYASPQDHQTYDFIVLAQEPETDPKFVIVDSVVQQPQNIEQQLKTLTQDGRVVMAYRHRDEKSNLLEDLVRLKNGERDLVPHDDKSMRSSIPTISSAPDEAMREIDHFVLIGREYNLSNGQIVRFAQKAVDNFHSGIRMSYEDVIKNFVLSGD